MNRLLLRLATLAVPMAVAAVSEPIIDFTRPIGKVKPIHGVGNSPVRLDYEGKGLVPEFAEAGIPYVRLHDAVGAFGGAHYVDVENIFPDMDADENDPQSYDFAFTDAYIKTLIDSGVQIFYRLGPTIENQWRVKSYHVRRPKDLAKFARVCEHIVRHYNKGWANGFRYGIEYWEVWNEPEVEGMWQGTKEEFFDLYREIAVLLKKEHPEIKVGGYSSIGFSYIDDPVASAGWKDRVECFLDFCDYVTAEKTRCPIDYFTWHCYVNRGGKVGRIRRHAEFVRKTLDEHGLTGVESILAEWNTRLFGYEGMRDHRGGAFAAKVLSIMQYTSIDKAMFYAAQPNAFYCGLYDFPSEATTPIFEVFREWNRFCQMGEAYAVPDGDETLGYAAVGGNRWKSVMIVNFKDRADAVKPAFKGIRDYARFMVRRIDAAHTAPTSVGMHTPGNVVDLPPWSVTYLNTFERE